MTPRDDVILSYGGMEDGTVVSSQLCPRCSGGQGKENTLSVGMTDGLLWWRCHRSSCGFRGGHRSDGRVSQGHPSRIRSARKYDEQRLPDDVLLMLAERLSVAPETFVENGWSYTSDFSGHGRRVIIPIRQADGTRRGAIFRSYWGGTPKALNEILPDMGESIAWFRASRYGRRVVVVEDALSAHRLMCSGIDALALLGTTINEARAIEIRDAGYTSAILTLDNDATDQAIRQVLRLGMYASLFNVKALEGEDIKDMDAETFSKFIEEVRPTT